MGRLLYVDFMYLEYEDIEIIKRMIDDEYNSLTLIIEYISDWTQFTCHSRSSGWHDEYNILTVTFTVSSVEYQRMKLLRTLPLTEMHKNTTELLKRFNELPYMTYRVQCEHI